MADSRAPEIFVDTNVIMRLFDTSDVRQTERSKKLFEDAKAGSIRLVVGPPVLFELVWVLRSTYGREKAEVLDIVEALMNRQGVRVLDADLVAAAVMLARRTVQGFADAYVAVSAQKYGFKVATYNTRHFLRFEVDLYAL